MNNLDLLAPFILVFSFLLSYYMLPKIIAVVQFKQLMDDPNDRSSHEIATPNLGGVSFYVALMISFYFIYRMDTSGNIHSIIPGLTVLFIAGLKDDLVTLSPISKLFTQIFAVTFIIFDYNFSFDSLHGFMGVENIPIFVAAPLAILIAVSIINAVNLIDGIDGLAGIVSIVMFLVFGTLFFFTNQNFLFLISLIMVGSLLAFLRFNLSNSKKIFMGDTGSMILGFMIAFMTIKFLSLDTTQMDLLPFYSENLPYIVMAILIVPMFDTVRVFTLRLMKRQNPFTADRNHIHHVLIDYYQISHRKTSLILGFVNFLFIVLFASLSMLINQWYLLLFFIVCIISAILFFFFLNRPKLLRGINYYKRKRMLYKLKNSKT